MISMDDYDRLENCPNHEEMGTKCIQCNLCGRFDKDDCFVISKDSEMGEIISTYRNMNRNDQKNLVTYMKWLIYNYN